MKGSVFSRIQVLTSVSDQDPDPDSISSVGPDQDLELDPGVSRRAKITYKNKKVAKFHVLKCWMSSFELKASPVAWTSFMETKG
jgi:hypothetical protein